MLSASSAFSGVIPVSSAISEVVGSRPKEAFSAREAARTAPSASRRWVGTRTVRDLSAMAREMARRIH